MDCNKTTARAFYHLMFKADDERMQHQNVQRYVTELSKLWGEPIRYYRRASGEKSGFQLVRTRPPRKM